MARAGDVIENPVSGERIAFEKTGAETDGSYLAGEIVLAPHGAGPPEHVHPVIEERFRVVSGTLGARVGGEARTVQAGESFTVPAGTPHRWWNDTAEEVRIAFEVRPALPLDRFLESAFALVHQGKSNRKGLPGPLRMAPILRRHADVLHLARPPLVVQRPLMRLLGALAGLLGYPDEYPYPYRNTPSPEGSESAAPS